MNPNFENVARAQDRRLQSRGVDDDAIMAMFEAMPPSRAYKLAQRALSAAVQRGMREAHARPVVAE